MRRALSLLALVVGIAGCELSTKPLPFQFDMQLSRTSAAPGDTIGVLVNAQGGSLANIQVDFADGTVLAFTTGGARTAQAVFPHAFTTAGTYTIKTTVTDNNEGEKSLTADVHIQ